MSAITSFVLVSKAALPALRDAAVPERRMFGRVKGRFGDFLWANGREVASYGWSGHVFATLLPVLGKKWEIDLMSSEFFGLARYLRTKRKGVWFILSSAHKRAYLARLAPERYSEAELREAYNAFNATDQADAGKPMLDGIRSLHESLQAVDDDSVVLLSIG